MSDKTIFQKSFFGKEITRFVFEKNVVNYSIKNSMFRDSTEPVDYSGIQFDTVSTWRDENSWFLYMSCLLGSMEILDYVFYNHVDLVFICMAIGSGIYYRSSRTYFTSLYSNGGVIYIVQDNKEREIIDELKARKALSEQQQIFIINEYANVDDEKERFALLLQEGKITPDEYEEIEKKLDEKLIADMKNIREYCSNFDEKRRFTRLFNESKITKEEFDFALKQISERVEIDSPMKKIIRTLLIEKGFSQDFCIDQERFENNYLPGGLQSTSGILRFEDGKRYNFRFDRDVDAIDPTSNQKGYYTLGDSPAMREKYARSFFYEIENIKP